MFLLHTARAASQQPLQLISFYTHIIARYASHFAVLDSLLRPVIIVECYAEIYGMHADSLLYVLLPHKVLVLSTRYEIIETITLDTAFNRDAFEVELVDLMARDILKNGIIQDNPICQASAMNNRISNEGSCEFKVVEGCIYFLKGDRMRILAKNFRISCMIQWTSCTVCNSKFYLLVPGGLYVFFSFKIIRYARLLGDSIAVSSDRVIVTSAESIYLLGLDDVSSCSTAKLAGPVKYIATSSNKEAIIHCVSNKTKQSIYYSVHVKDNALCIVQLPCSLTFDYFAVSATRLIGFYANILYSVEDYKIVCQRAFYAIPFQSTSGMSFKGHSSGYLKFVNRKYFIDKHISIDCARYLRSNTKNSLDAKNHDWENGTDIANTRGGIITGLCEKENNNEGNSKGATSHKIFDDELANMENYIPGITEVYQKKQSEWMLCSMQDIYTISNAEQHQSFAFSEHILDFKVNDDLIIIQTNLKTIKLFSIRAKKFTFVQCFSKDILDLYIDEVLKVVFSDGYELYYVLKDRLSHCFKKGTKDGPRSISMYEYCGIVNDSDTSVNSTDRDIIFTNSEVYIKIEQASNKSTGLDCKQPPGSTLFVHNDKIKAYVEQATRLIVEANGLVMSKPLAEEAVILAEYDELLVVGSANNVYIYKIGLHNILNKAKLDIKGSDGFIKIGEYFIINNASNSFILLHHDKIVFSGHHRVTAACLFEECIFMGTSDGYIKGYTMNRFVCLCSIYVCDVPVIMKTFKTKNRKDLALFYYSANGRMGELVRIDSTFRILSSISKPAYEYRPGQFGVVDRNNTILRFDPFKSYTQEDWDVYEALQRMN